MDESNDLNVSLQHFWGSSYWTTILQQSPELSRATIEVLMKKNQEIDLLRAQLMRLQANERKTFQQHATPPAAAEPERYGVGERVEGDWANRAPSQHRSNPEWRMAKIVRHRDSSVYPYAVLFDDDLGEEFIMSPSEVRRPVAAPAERKFVFGERVRVGIDTIGTDHAAHGLAIFAGYSGKNLCVLIEKYMDTIYFSPDQVHHID